MFYISQLYYLFSNTVYDFYRYLVYSTTIFIKKKSILEARIMANAHVIEKGLSFKNTKLKFGQIIISHLIQYLKLYIKLNYPIDNFAFQSGLNALRNYEKYHSKLETNIPYVTSFLSTISNDIKISIFSSAITVNTKSLSNNDNKNFKDLAFSRHSVRYYQNKKISKNIIEEATKIAIQTPSVCNRQPWKIYYLEDHQKIKTALKYQSGNRGFGPKIKNLFIISVDLNAYQGFNERYQAYIDGGLFGMSFTYALHYLGIASCMLNWDVNFDTDLKLKNELSLPANESIICYISAGYYENEISSPRSMRKEVDEVLFNL